MGTRDESRSHDSGDSAPLRTRCELLSVYYFLCDAALRSHCAKLVAVGEEV